MAGDGATRAQKRCGGIVVDFDDKLVYMGVVVSQNNDMSNTYEVHDAVIVEKRKEGINALAKTPSADNNQTRRGDDNPHIAIVLSELADYNTEFQENSPSAKNPRTT